MRHRQACYALVAMTATSACGSQPLTSHSNSADTALRNTDAQESGDEGQIVETAESALDVCIVDSAESVDGAVLVDGETDADPCGAEACEFPNDATSSTDCYAADAEFAAECYPDNTTYEPSGDTLGEPEASDIEDVDGSKPPDAGFSNDSKADATTTPYNPEVWTAPAPLPKGATQLVGELCQGADAGAIQYYCTVDQTACCAGVYSFHPCGMIRCCNNYFSIGYPNGAPESLTAECKNIEAYAVNSGTHTGPGPLGRCPALETLEFASLSEVYKGNCGYLPKCCPSFEWVWFPWL